MNQGNTMTDLIQDIARSLDSGSVIPYMGPDMLALCADVKVPATPLALAESMTAKVSVPHKIRKRLTQAAQFIENFKHRKSVVHLMNEAFAATPAPSPLQLALAASNDVVLIAGKGHEDYQETAGGRIAFSDLAHARRALDAWAESLPSAGVVHE